MPDSTCEMWWRCSTCKQCKTLLPIHGAIHSTAVQSTHKLFSMWSISAVSIATAAPLLHCRYGIWPQSHSNWTRFWTKVPYATGLWAFKVLQQLAFPGETDPKFSIVKVPNKFMDNKVVNKKKLKFLLHSNPLLIWSDLICPDMTYLVTDWLLKTILLLLLIREKNR